MLSLSHTIASLPLGIYLQNPYLIFMAAFLLHFILDATLHWNIYPPHHSKFPAFLVSLDVLGGLLLAWLIVGDNFFTIPVLAAIAGSNAPDIIHSLWELADKPKNKYTTVILPFFRFHDNIQWETNHVALGLISQIIVIATVIAIT